MDDVAEFLISELAGRLTFSSLTKDEVETRLRSAIRDMDEEDRVIRRSRLSILSNPADSYQATYRDEFMRAWVDRA